MTRKKAETLVARIVDSSVMIVMHIFFRMDSLWPELAAGGQVNILKNYYKISWHWPEKVKIYSLIL